MEGVLSAVRAADIEEPSSSDLGRVRLVIEYIATPFVDDLIGHYARLMPAIPFDVLNWRYKNNVEGPSLIGQALLGAEVVGMTPFMRVRLKGEGETLLNAFHAIDTIVAPEARGKGVFVELGRTTCAAAQDAGAKLVYGFPNAAAAKGWFKHNNWINLGRAPFMVCPVRTGLFAERLTGRRLVDFKLPAMPTSLKEVTTVSRFGAEFDALWKAFSKNVNCAVDRSSAYLNWRFVRAPSSPYHTVAVKEGDAVIAFVTSRTAMKHGGHIGYIMEAMSLPGRESVLLSLLRWVRRDLARSGVDAIMAMSFPHSPNFKTFRKAGFWTIPDKVVPIEVHFGALPLAPGGECASRRENWYLSYLDSDSA